ncbi:hypothetical protein VTO58DRAFT_110908 [Aureobasidium pullulans]
MAEDAILYASLRQRCKSCCKLTVDVQRRFVETTRQYANHSRVARTFEPRASLVPISRVHMSESKLPCAIYPHLQKGWMGGP